jgi:hypothetical protein
MQTKAKMISISARIRETDLKWLERQAQKKDVSMSQILRDVLKKAVSRR